MNFLLFYPIPGPRDTPDKELQHKSQSLWLYMEEITGNSRIEQGKIVAIIETLSWESVRQNSAS